MSFSSELNDKINLVRLEIHFKELRAILKYGNMGSLTSISRYSSEISKLVTLSYDSFGRKLSYFGSDTGVTIYYF